MTSGFPTQARGLRPAFSLVKSGFCWSLEEPASLLRFLPEPFQTPLFAGARFLWPFWFLCSLRWEPRTAHVFPRTCFCCRASGSAGQARVCK